jgi:hypothetical protein
MNELEQKQYEINRLHSINNSSFRILLQSNKRFVKFIISSESSFELYEEIIERDLLIENDTIWTVFNDTKEIIEILKQRIENSEFSFVYNPKKIIFIFYHKQIEFKINLLKEESRLNDIKLFSLVNDIKNKVSDLKQEVSAKFVEFDSQLKISNGQEINGLVLSSQNHEIDEKLRIFKSVILEETSKMLDNKINIFKEQLGISQHIKFQELSRQISALEGMLNNLSPSSIGKPKVDEEIVFSKISFNFFKITNNMRSLEKIQDCWIGIVINKKIPEIGVTMLSIKINSTKNILLMIGVTYSEKNELEGGFNEDKDSYMFGLKYGKFWNNGNGIKIINDLKVENDDIISIKVNMDSCTLQLVKNDYLIGKEQKFHKSKKPSDVLKFCLDMETSGDKITIFN